MTSTIRRPFKALIALSDFYQAYDLSLFLARWCSDMMICESMQEAVTAMERERFHLFMLDARLPSSLEGKTNLYSGLDLVRHIRLQREPICRSTVVFCRNSATQTGLLEAIAEIREAIDAGASCALSCPVTPEKFETEILPELRGFRPFVRHAAYRGPCRRRYHIKPTRERRAGDKRVGQERTGQHP